MSADMMKRMLDRAMSGVRTAFRGVLTGLSTAAPAALVQADALSGEQLQDNELMQHYGFTSAPPAGTQIIVLPLGGKTAHGVIIATEHGTFRLKGLKSGESALYDDQGQCVHLTRDGIVIKGAGKPITITDTPKVRIESELEVTGTIKDLCDTTGKTMSSMRETYNGHSHPDPQGGDVGTPSEQM
jgi:phage baseplate assembly protein V